MFSIYYNKNNNSKLFEHLEKNDFQKVQNFVPLYLNYFNLDEKKYNSINLNQKYNIQSILKKNQIIVLILVVLIIAIIKLR